MPIHDHVTSVLNLARTIKSGIDHQKTHTLVQNELLKLIIDTFIEVSTPGHQQRLADQAKRSVAGMIAPPILDDRPGGGGGWL